ncbi:N6-isopentenyladenosine methylthiotransferase [Aureococcus anophagefferens]|nr:N6-isopentenyladenosine methylthiotransferase [Aureococcus anophagefferens]
MRRLFSSQPRLAALRRKLKHEARAAAAAPAAPSNGSSFFIETRGCQMNVSDSEVVRSLLLDGGYGEATSAAAADVVLLNTCAIRDKAEAKVWTRLRDLRGRAPHGVKLAAHRRPRQTVAVLGCMAERVEEGLFENGLADVMDTKLSLVEDYGEVFPTRADPTMRHGALFRATGLQQRCGAHCIVPYTRGRERSRAVTTVLDEVAALYDAGVREITLLGQNVNSYHDAKTASAWGLPREYSDGFVPFVKSAKRDGMADGVRFAELLVAVAEAAPDARIRFTSPHPKDFPDALLRAVADTPNVAKQLHLPAQSGSDAVLRSMRRGYTDDAYRALVDRARQTIPGVALSSDFIAGFCGESEADHDATVALIEDIRYDMAFLFAYSSRDRTPAQRRLDDDVPADVKNRRLNEIIAAFRAGRDELSHEAVGETHLIVFPDALPDGTALAEGDFCHVYVDRVEGATLFGVAVARAAGAGDRPDVWGGGARRWARN